MVGWRDGVSGAGLLLPHRDGRPSLMEAAKDAAGTAAAAGAGVAEKAQAGAAGMAAKAGSALDDLDDALPPSLRTAKQIAKKFGANKAGREACLALAKGERLTPTLKKALFRMGAEAKLEKGVMAAFIKQSEGIGVTPMELEAMDRAAKEAKVPKELRRGFGWMASENAGPGTISVILEAQALIRGLDAAVDMDDMDVEAVRDLRDMVHGKKLRPMDAAEFIMAVTGTAAHGPEEKFWTRFCQDALAISGSAEEIMLYQLLLGRGVGFWSPCKLPEAEQAQVLPNLMRRIARGAPPVKPPPPSAEEVAESASLLASAFQDSDVDEAECRDIFKESDKDGSGTLTVDELAVVCIDIIKTVRDHAVKEEADKRLVNSITDKFGVVIKHFELDSGKKELQEMFDPSHDGSTDIDEFVQAFPRFVAKLAGEDLDETEPVPETEPETEPEAEPDSTGEPDAFEMEPMPTEEPFEAENAGLTKVELKAQRKQEKQREKDAKAKAKRDAKWEKKKEKQAAKVAKKKAKARAKAASDADGEEVFTGKEIPIPKGGIEFFLYLANHGSFAPRGLAAALYIAVNEGLPHEFATTLQNLVTGVELDAQDLAHLLALLCRKTKSLQHAAKDFVKLTRVALENNVRDMEFLKEHWRLQIEEFKANSDYNRLHGYEPLLFEVGLGQRQLERFVHDMCTRLHLLHDAKINRDTYRTEITVDIDPNAAAAERAEKERLEAEAAEAAAKAEALAEAANEATGAEDGVSADGEPEAEGEEQIVAEQPTPELLESEPSADVFEAENGDAGLSPEEQKEKIKADKAEAKAAKKRAKRGEPEPVQEPEPVPGDTEKWGDCRLVDSRKFGRLANTIYRIARANSVVSNTAMAELYEIASGILQPMYLGNSGLEGCIDGHWADALAEKAAAAETAGVAADGGSDEYDNPVAVLEDEESTEADLRTETNASAPVERVISGDLELADRVQGGEDDFGEGSDALETANEPTGEPDDVDLKPDNVPLTPRGGGASPTELQRYAQEYEPEFVESTMNSLIELLAEQSIDCRVLSGFQDMILRHPLTSEQAEIFHILAARHDVSTEVIDAVLWMWCGGACVDEASLRKMCSDATRAQSPRSGGLHDTKGELTLEVLRATNLLKKDKFGKSDPYCCVRVEGHQRNTAVIKKNLNPEWNASFGYRVADRMSAVVEIYLFDENKNGTDALGRVTFPLHIVEPGTPLEMDFTIEPMRIMEEKHGDLGQLRLRMLFETSEIQPDDEELPTCHAIEALVEAAHHKNMNKDLIDMLREAGAIVLTRAKRDLEEGHGNTQVKDTLEELEAQAMKEAEEGQRGLSKGDLTYDADADRAAFQATLRPMRQKYMTAIAYTMSKFVGINPAVIGVIAGTINKFAPAPEVTGCWSAAVLGLLGLPTKALPGIKSFLRDRLKEEMEKLVRASKLDSNNFNQLQKICRGQGCAQSAVDRASEMVAEADSFSTAGALFRLKAGQGAAEPNEVRALDELVEGSGDDFIKAGVQNLQLMIWPALEDTFHKVRELIDGNTAAEMGLSGWENRAELALILRPDPVAYGALTGLVQMEQFKKYLVAKDKELELIALQKVMSGDKAANAIMRKLTPSFGEKVSTWWKGLDKFSKFKVGFAIFFAALFLLMWMATIIGLDGTIGKVLLDVIKIILYICTAILAVLVGIWFIMKGKPYRDKVVGPNSTGVDFLRKLCESAEDPEDKKNGLSALQLMLMGHEPETSGKEFLRMRATK